MKKKYLLLLAVGFVITLSMQGQITTHELPVSFKKDIPLLERNTKSIKVMPTINMAKIQQEDEEDEANGMLPRFGFRHKVDYNLENSGEWTDLPNGDKIWRLMIHCPGSLSINLLYNKFWIPADAKFFIYSNDRKHSIGAITAANNKGDSINIQGFATGLVYGDTVTLEYYLPDSVKERGIISIDYVVHGYRYIELFGNADGKYHIADTCNININCPQGNNWQNEKNAIAMMVLNGNYMGSGSLINTTANDARPLFLTANHCMKNAYKDAEGDSILTSWLFYWHYESPGCTSTDTLFLKSTSGATLIANDSTSDFALLRLTENPKGGGTRS